MRADRLLAILLLLQTRGRSTAAALAERLEVSQRTIYRDLDALSAAGVPVYAERGAHGGCILRPGYRTDLTGLNAEEVAALFAGTAGRQLDPLGVSLKSALAKLEAALPSERRDDAERVRQRILVDALPWFEPQPPAAHLDVLRRAVMEQRALRLSYRRPDARATARTVHPLGLVVKGGIWYLVAQSEGALRVYRCSRLRRVALTRARFERPARFELASFWSRWSADFVRGIPEYRFTLAVPRRARPILLRAFGERMRAALEKARPGGRDRHLVEFSLDTFADACGALLGLGTSVEVVAPVELRQAIAAEAAKVVAMYRRRTKPRARAVRAFGSDGAL